jgi:hypothetical protein
MCVVDWVCSARSPVISVGSCEGEAGCSVICVHVKK